MDYVVDSSSLTAPAIPFWGRNIYRSGNEETSNRFIESFEKQGGPDAAWVALYTSGGTSVVLAAPRRHASSFKVTSLTSEAATRAEVLRRSLEFIYCNDEASIAEPEKSRVALRGVIDAVEDLADSKDYAALDDLLVLVNPLRLRPVTSVAFLRSSFASKERLNNWNGLYQVVYAHLANRGENPARALRGMSGPDFLV